MSTPMNRRLMLRHGTTLCLTLATIPIISLCRTASAGAASKSDFHYQDHPHDGKKCAECSAFVPASQSQNTDGTCRIVGGPISPLGWCMAFSGKG